MGRRAEEGVTLIEIVITLGVLALAIMAVFSMLLLGIRLDELNRERDLAKDAVTTVIEKIKAHDFDSIKIDYGEGGDPGNTFVVDGLYNSQGEILIDSSNPELLDIRVRLTWEGREGTNTYEARVMISRP
jgi:hypothetical protein